MAERKARDVVLRPKRQITLPIKVFEQLDIRPGDTLELLSGDLHLDR
ncbi:MAG: AbrB/MazE/SpoVT family DNA-binding domain-containing protein [Dehalococcoidia bacterium]|jgi:bifunctional DNA-binding transcriptional regulator/antitoxin component of YhaV-PrlF toxin-antitoxin module|nr:AbrB/MazE/SpoVT family DNA-binding domain-containing protein [Dehalococcoidia bacterium]